MPNLHPVKHALSHVLSHVLSRVMAHVRRPLVGCLVALGLLTASSTDAHADTLPRLYAGLLGGYSAATEDLTPDPWGPALGARAGLTIPTTDIYVGGMFLYHLGVSADGFDGDVGELSGNTLLVSAEGGYEWKLGPIILRPSLGLGFANQSLTISSGGLSGSADVTEGSFYLSPGMNVMLAMFLMVGAEVRYNALVNSDSYDSISVLGTLGFTI